MVNESVLNDVTVEESDFPVALKNQIPSYLLGICCLVKSKGVLCRRFFSLLRSGWGVMGLDLSMHGQTRSSGYFLQELIGIYIIFLISVRCFFGRSYHFPF